MTEFGQTSTRVGESVITSEDGAQQIQKQQAQMDHIADEAAATPEVSAALHGLADAMGKVRVFIIEKGEIDPGTIKKASDRVIAACQAVP